MQYIATLARSCFLLEIVYSLLVLSSGEKLRSPFQNGIYE